ncbi:unnamed protein product [Linum trigynum]|uniref:Uncharacterized protein n=1 Tax=Linum trigynum TaxID=586398 RepID=A0AAV2DC02_9ROSI
MQHRIAGEGSLQPPFFVRPSFEDSFVGEQLLRRNGGQSAFDLISDVTSLLPYAMRRAAGVSAADDSFFVSASNYASASPVIFFLVSSSAVARRPRGSLVFGIALASATTMDTTGAVVICMTRGVAPISCSVSRSPSPPLSRCPCPF